MCQCFQTKNEYHRSPSTKIRNAILVEYSYISWLYSGVGVVFIRTTEHRYCLLTVYWNIINITNQSQYSTLKADLNNVPI